MANKQIKDFDLKENVDGTEDILIQDNGITKRIKASEFVSKNILNKKNKYTISDFIDNSTVKDANGYIMTDVLINLISNNEKTSIEIDVDIVITNPIKLKSYLNIYSNNNSKITFEGCDGFYTDTNDDRLISCNLYNLIICGDKTDNTTLLKLQNNGTNCKFYELLFKNGYNAIYINGWVYNIHNVVIDGFNNNGLELYKSDNTFSDFYINGCKKYGLYLKSSNNRLSNFKILTCGKENESVYINGSRNFITNFEIQDIYVKAIKFEFCNYNDILINIDAIRTNLIDASSIEIASFLSCKNNILNIVACKYGTNVSNNSEYDTIYFDDYSYNNTIMSSLSKVMFSGNPNNRIIDNVQETLDFVGENLFDKLTLNIKDAIETSEEGNIKTYTTTIANGGYRIPIDKNAKNIENGNLICGKYLLIIDYEVDKASSLYLTDRGNPECKMKLYSLSKIVYKCKSIITISDTSGGQLGILLDTADVKIGFKSIKIFKVPDTFDENKLFYLK